MKLFKMFSVGAACCLAFNLVVADVPSSITTCPVGGAGACTTRPMPAGSYSNARSVPGLTTEGLRPIVGPLIPEPVAATGPSGSYCGRLVVYTDTNSITERIPCAGYSLYKDVPVEYYVPPSDGYYIGGDNPTYVDANPGYYTTVMTRVADCPPSYGLSLIGGAGPYGFYSCIKG